VKQAKKGETFGDKASPKVSPKTTCVVWYWPGITRLDGQLPSARVVEGLLPFTESVLSP
jgi:hypothetical protein